ncbi:MAG: Macrolide export ATP-binding/permease protein MacB [Verrucomicrobiales bacterium]|jgi:putative ABC transport system permease protein|nr:Macrolide export ATP-binding/permease protein MacB [Verrucomicrobiales bacterium]MDB6129897.1 Macrolide export ATP-binding/permease protein MacB [Verrucomicrobiales bacterium]
MRITTELAEGIRISWSAIAANKLRAGLTTLGIVIGIVTVTLMATAITGINTAFRQSISQMGTDVLYIQKFQWGPPDQEWWTMRNRRDITISEAKAMMRQINNAVAVSIEASTGRNITFKGRTARGVWTVGNTVESAIVRGLVVKQGRFFTEGEVDGARPVCVLGADLAANLFPVESPLGQKVRIDGAPFEVIGVIDKMGTFLFGNLDNQIIIPITRYLTQVAHRPDVSIMVKVKRPEDMDEAKEELRGIARKVRHVAPGKPDDFSINQQDILIKTFNRVGGAIATLGLFITGLSLFVGGIGIMNIMFVSVAERTREIGIRKAIGAKKRTILIQFLSEAATICLCGGALAVAIAWPITLLLNTFLPTSMSLPIVGLALFTSIATGVVAGFLPAYRAACMNPVDALRNE